MSDQRAALQPLPFPSRAAFASQPQASRGRLFPAGDSPTRSAFQRDRDRIIHSTAFRRLAHKTQVFVPHEGDHYRTRLTHTIEVSQIARAISRAFALDDDLAEALALAHDLGHTPFGHAGEDVLDELMAPWGGFDHNAQALRIVTRLERRYADHDGLNLTWETLEGLVKHNGPMRGLHAVAKYAAKGVPLAISAFDAIWPLELDSFASAEAQAAAIADDIAYNAHDIDDGLRAGLFDLDALRQVDFLADVAGDVEKRHPGLERFRMINEIVRRVITRFVEDVIGESSRRIAASGAQNVEAIRGLNKPVIAFSPAMTQADRDLKAFLYPQMYRHPNVMRVRNEAMGVVEALFHKFAGDPGIMPGEWGQRAQAPGLEAWRIMRLIADYIAGMTDRYALAEHQRVFGSAPALR